MNTTTANTDNLIITIGKAYAWLSEKYGKETAENITALSTAQQEQKLAEKGIATKEDLASVRNELKVEIANTKAEMIKWMFIFWVGQLAAMFGLLYFFLKK
jgi:hypothetical protein